MTPSREDLELYVIGSYDGDIDALERAIADDPALAAIVADEARLDEVLRDAAAAATFCVGCSELVRGERCDHCGIAVRPGGYLVERVLVSNAHGRMYVARDADGRQVALKELAFVHAPSPAALAAFERVCTRYYLAQELVEGTPLDRIDEHWYSEAEVVEIAKQVLGVLVYLQSLSPMVIHRDIKPANLLRRPAGSIALVDFGAAHVHGTTAGSTTIGTFGYMPIEQLAGVVDATTDVYALGATLLYLLTREEPWKLAQTKSSVNVSAPLRAYLDKLTAPDPRDRFASAKDARAALDNREAIVPAKKKVARRRRWPLVAIGAAALATSGGIGAYALLSPDEAPPLGYIHLVTGVHDDFDAFVDGQFWGTAAYDTMLHVTPGRHTISVKSKHGTCSDEVVVDPGFTTRLDCEVGSGLSGAQVNSEMGQLRIRITPDINAMIDVDGAAGVVRDQQILGLRAGWHTIKIAGENHTCEHRVEIWPKQLSELECVLGDAPTKLASLRFAMPAGITAELFVDGERIASVTADTRAIPVKPGVRHVRLVGANGLACDDPRVKLEAGITSTVECNFGGSR